MCGIFGIITKENSNYKDAYLKKTLTHLAKLSEARGKDSSGICIRSNEKKEFRVLKSNQPISGLLKSEEYKLLSNKYTSKNQFFSFGHSRLVTNGSQLESNNNQPVVKDNLIAIHNGIIVNVNEINSKFNLKENLILIQRFFYH